jgi:hypothetical protein
MDVVNKLLQIFNIGRTQRAHWSNNHANTPITGFPSEAATGRPDAM